MQPLYFRKLTRQKSIDRVVVVALEAELLNIEWTKFDLDHDSLALIEVCVLMPRIPNLGPSKKSISLSRRVYQAS